jgi:hypothetical protein
MYAELCLILADFGGGQSKSSKFLLMIPYFELMDPKLGLDIQTTTLYFLPVSVLLMGTTAYRKQYDEGGEAVPPSVWHQRPQCTHTMR